MLWPMKSSGTQIRNQITFREYLKEMDCSEFELVAQYIFYVLEILKTHIPKKTYIYTYQINGFILDVVESVAFTRGSRHSNAGKKESEEEEEGNKRTLGIYSV